jgi:hypothetical protein
MQPAPRHALGTGPAGAALVHGDDGHRVCWQAVYVTMLLAPFGLIIVIMLLNEGAACGGPINIAIRTPPSRLVCTACNVQPRRLHVDTLSLTMIILYTPHRKHNSVNSP